MFLQTGKRLNFAKISKSLFSVSGEEAELVGAEPGKCGCKKRKSFSDGFCILHGTDHVAGAVSAPSANRL